MRYHKADLRPFPDIEERPTIALFIARAPCEPPKIRCSFFRLSAWHRYQKTRCGRDCPSQHPLLPKNGSASSKVNAALSTNLASCRLVKPGKRVRIHHKRRNPIKPAIIKTGPETYPPAPTTTSGLNSFSSFRASRKLFGNTASPFILPEDADIFQSGAVDQRELKAIFRHDLCFKPSRRADK